MNKPLNNYLRILLYLKNFEGDGKMHEVENIFDVDNNVIITLLRELAREDYVNLYGGQNGKMFGGEYIPATAKITLKGSRYLKEELEMIDNNKYNIRIGDNTTANLIMHSPGSAINNKSEVLARAEKIIETLKKDESIAAEVKNEAVLTLTSFVEEIERGNPSKETFDKILSIGSNISSISSLILSLAQLFV